MKINLPVSNYISCGSSTNPNIILCDFKNNILYCSRYLVCLFNVKDFVITKSWPSLHEITCFDVCSIGEADILSVGHNNGLISLYHFNNKYFHIHNAKTSITNLKIIALNVVTFLIVYSSLDTIEIALLENDNQINYKINIKYHLCTSLKIMKISDTKMLFFIGLTSGDLLLYQIDIKIIPNLTINCSEKYVLKGHTDWIRCIDIIFEDIFYIVTCSQDNTIKIWNMKLEIEVVENAITDIFDGTTKQAFNISLETTLLAHKNWVYTVMWHPKAFDPECPHFLNFISASLDETVIIWEYDRESMQWIDKERLGVNKGLGFLGAIYSPTGDEILAHTIKGGIYRWFCEKTEVETYNDNNNNDNNSDKIDINDMEKDSHRWKPGLMLSGHTGPVNDIAWQSLPFDLCSPENNSNDYDDNYNKNNYNNSNNNNTKNQNNNHKNYDHNQTHPSPYSYLVSVSNDQTTRIHGKISTLNLSTSRRTGKCQTCWTEIARPQVHGYDLNCVAWIDAFTFASGAEEKVIRIFRAPQSYVENILRWSGKEIVNRDALGGGEEDMTRNILKNLPESISCNPLDLTNVKQLREGSDLFKTDFPTENLLHQSTLWLEERKLYGHGNEIYALAYNPVYQILASSCKATKPEFANIYLWDCAPTAKTIADDKPYLNQQQFKLIGKLAVAQSHTLTVTRIKFSPCGRLMLSVSRDRSWRVYEIQDDSRLYELIDTSIHIMPNPTIGNTHAHKKKKSLNHTRIIWDCAWLPQNDVNKSISRGPAFITVSRDKKAIIWTSVETHDNTDKHPLSHTWDTCKEHVITLETPITAVDVAPIIHKNICLIALGLENGTIKLYSIHKSELSLEIQSLDEIKCHSLTVKRVSFNPQHQHIQYSENTVNQTNSNDKIETLLLASCSEDGSVQIHKLPLTFE